MKEAILLKGAMWKVARSRVLVEWSSRVLFSPIGYQKKIWPIYHINYRKNAHGSGKDWTQLQTLGEYENVLLKLRLHKTPDLRKMKEVVKTMRKKDILISTFCFTQFLQSYQKLGMTTSLENCFTMLEEENEIDSFVYNFMLAYYLKENKDSKFLETKEKLLKRTLPPDDVFFYLLAQFYVKQDEITSIDQLFQDAAHYIEINEDFKHRFFSAVLHAATLHKNIPIIIKYTNECLKNKIKLNERTVETVREVVEENRNKKPNEELSSLLSHLAQSYHPSHENKIIQTLKHGKTKVGINLLKELLQLKPAESSLSERSINTAISVLLLEKIPETEKMEDVEYIYERIRDVGQYHTLATFNLFLKVWYRLNNEEKFASVFKDLCCRYTPNELSYSYQFRLVVKNNFSSGHSLLRDLHKRGICTSTMIYNNYITAAAWRTNSEEIAKTLELMLSSDIFPDDFTWKVIATRYQNRELLLDDIEKYSSLSRADVVQHLEQALFNNSRRSLQK